MARLVPRIAGALLLAALALASLAPYMAAPASAGPSTQPGAAQGQGPWHAAPSPRAVEALMSRVERMINIIGTYNETLASSLNQTLAEAQALLDQGNVTGAFQLTLEAAREAAQALHSLKALGWAVNATASVPPEALERAIEVHEMHAERLLEAAEALSDEYNTGHVVELLNQSLKLLEEARQMLEAGNTSAAAQLLSQAVRLIGEATSEFYGRAKPALAMEGGLAGLVRQAYRALYAINQTYQAINSSSPNATQELQQAIEETQGALRHALMLQRRPHVMVTWFTEPLNTLATALETALALLNQADQALQAGNTSEALALVGQARDTLAAALGQVQQMAGMWPPLAMAVQAGRWHHGMPGGPWGGHGPMQGGPWWGGPGTGCPCGGQAGGDHGEPGERHNGPGQGGPWNRP